MDFRLGLEAGNCFGLGDGERLNQGSRNGKVGWILEMQRAELTGCVWSSTLY